MVGPEYWESMIPMHYATHVVSPVLGLMDHRAEYVSCFGSGRVRDEIREKSGNQFAVESCHIKLVDSDVSAHIWRFLYDTARQYRESFDVYGTKKSFEWTLVEGEPHVMHTAKRPEPEIPEKVEIPDFAHRLPAEIQKFTQSIEDAGHLSFVQGGGPRRLASAFGKRICAVAQHQPRPLAQRRDQCQLDLRRYLGPRIGHCWRGNPATTRVYAKIASGSAGGRFRFSMRHPPPIACNKPMPTCRIFFVCLLLLSIPAELHAKPPHRLHTFQRLQLSDQFFSEGATSGDIKSRWAARSDCWPVLVCRARLHGSQRILRSQTVRHRRLLG